jgi:hypothetical protein
MLNHFIGKLQQTIQWAQQQDDIEVLCLARESMNQLLDFADGLPATEQVQIHQHLDRLLPMEWPLWMEACRYQDGTVSSASPTLH